MSFDPTIIITGTIAKEPETRYTPEGKAVLSFSVPLYTGGSKEKGYSESLWVKIVAWEILAEQWQSLTKGMKVKVSGTPKPKRMYTNKDGVEVQTDLEITANKIEVVGRTSTDEETERQVEVHSHGSPDIDF